MIGTVIGNYRVVQKLGEGGMGTVFKAVDVMLEREVALKLLRPEFAGQSDLAERFRTEAIILARLNHPNIATLYGLSRESDRMFMVMEFVQGETLEHLVERQGALPASASAQWSCQVLDAMEYAHRRGVVHRDIKPANLMVTEEGIVKVMDFGIARVLGSAHQTQLGHVIGTASYMAPEQIRGQEVDGRTDLYALGIVLYQLLTGHGPFRGADEFAIMTAHVTQAPAPPSSLVAGLPEWLDAAILQALAKAPSDRFQSAADFRAALEAGLQSLAAGVTAPRSGPVVAGAPASQTQASTRLSGSRSKPGSAPMAAPAFATPLPAPPPEPIRETRLSDADAYASTLLPPTRLATGPRETRLGTPARETRMATGPELGAAAAPGWLARLTWLHYAGIGAATVIVVGVPLLWLALREPVPATIPPGSAPQSVAAGNTSQPATPSASQQGQSAVGLPPADTGGRRPIVDQQPFESPRTVLPPATRTAPPTGPAPTPTDKSRSAAPPSAEPAPPPPAAEPKAPAPPPAETRSPPAAASHPAAAVEPNRNTEEPEVFDGVEMMMRENVGKPVVLRLYSSWLEILPEDSEKPLKTLPYKTIVSASYQETRAAKEQPTGGLGVLKGAVSRTGQLFGAGKHWLTIETADGPIIVRLGRSYKDVIPMFEQRSRIKVKTIESGK